MPSVPDPDHVKPWYLRNITEALALDEASGNVYVRTGIAGDIIIEGNVVIPGDINSHIVEVGSSGNLELQGINYLPIGGNVIVESGNINANVSGNVSVTQGTDPWVISGNVNIGTMPEVEIKNDLNNPLPISANLSVNSNTNPIYVRGVSDSTFFAPWQSDAFGRLRVSEPFSLFDSSFRYGDKTTIWNSALTGSATAQYQTNTKVIAMTVSATNDEVIRETRCVFQYQPGKSLLILNTFSMATLTSGLRQRVGYFGARNGIYFEADGTTLNLVIRKDITGTVDDTTEKVPQSLWNGDRLDGNGGMHNLSGIDLDPTIAQIFWTDVEWLGVGSVRCGFVIDGVYHICHTFNHANNSTLSLKTPYMATSSLPIRYEIKATGSASGTMNQICSSVISEGGYEPRSTLQTVSMGVTTRSLTTSGTFYPLVSIRLASDRLDSIVRLAQLQSLITTSSSSPKNVYFQIIRNATLTDASWQNHSGGTVQYDLSATSFTGGDVITTGYFSASTRAELGSINDFNYQIGRSIGGVSDIVTVVCTPDTNNLDVAIDLGWYDLS